MTVATTPTPVWQATLRRRLLVAAALLTLWSVGIEARLVYLQVVRYDDFVAQADNQQTQNVEIPASRGEVRDRNGRPLAMSGEAPTITAELAKVKNPLATVNAICKVLSDCSADDRAQYLKQLTRPDKKVVYLRRVIEQEKAERIQALELDGIGFFQEPRRFHPNGELAAHLLGFVNREHLALSGLESTYKEQLEGAPGIAIISKDANRHVLDKRIEKAPTAGAILELTIDANIQAIVERELHAGINENDAPSGSVIVMDPWTGEILAMANWPTFDPDALRGVDPELLHNAAVESLYEPGSTFKIVTASAALEQHLVSPDSIIDTGNGLIRFGKDDVVHDTHPSASLSFTDVIVKSSNVGAITVGLQLGAERLRDYVIRFGFGQRADKREFPPESKGMVADVAQLSHDAALARVSMGYMVGVTPLQMAVAVSSIANGGELLKPRVVGAIVRNGKREVLPKSFVRRTVTPEVAAQLTTIMEGVVERGTATAAQIPGYTVAGKTGTAARLVNHHYSKTEYNASFVGFVPSRQPVYTIVVVINSPHSKKGYYGGTVSAPVFRRIAEQLLAYGRVPSSSSVPTTVLVERGPGGGHEVRTSGPSTAPVVVTQETDDSVVPDVTGLSAREALRSLTRLGIRSKLRGDSGLIVEQKPAAGTPVTAGATMTLWLGRESSRKTDTATQ
jgi:cell division protein FtsI (penicillin-binding protein 3)